MTVQHCVVKNTFPLQERGNLIILAAGPLCKQPGTVAFRIVLVCSVEKNEFSTRMECFPDWPQQTEKGDFSQGHYFNAANFSTALRDFGERIVDSARFTDSMYR